MEKKPYRKSGLGERGLFPLIFAHAKDGNPTTLLTRFAEELRRAPAAGGAGGRCLILYVEFLII